MKCLQFTLSKLIGLGIVFSSVILKIPQMFNIIKSKSCVGISFGSFCNELILYIFTWGYNIHLKNPMSLYGENISLAVQDLIILSLFVKYGNISI